MENKIKVNNIFLKYAWKWKLMGETCLICQEEFNMSCHKCTHPIMCVPCIGCCGHEFHLHCIEEWLKNNPNCPTCRSVWDFKKIFKQNNTSKM